MANELGIIFGVISMLGFGLSNAIAQPIIRKIGSWNAIVWQTLVSTVILLLVFFFYPAGFTLSWELIGFSAIIGLIGVLPLFTFYKALDAGKVGIVVAVANTFGVFTILLSILILGESLAASQILPIITIIAGVVLISFKLSDMKGGGMTAGIPYAIFTSLFWGIYFFLLNYPVSVLGPVFTALFTQFAVAMISAAYAWRKGELSVSMDAHTKKLVLFSGTALAAGVGAFNVGISMANVSIIAPLVSAAPLVAAAYAMVFYRERLTRQQYLAMLIIISGIIALSI